MKRIQIRFISLISEKKIFAKRAHPTPHTHTLPDWPGPLGLGGLGGGWVGANGSQSHCAGTHCSKLRRGEGGEQNYK